MTTILDILGTSTPVSEVLAEKIGYIRAAIACRIFFYEQLKNGLCSASIGTLAKKLGMSGGAVSSNLEWLRDNNYVVVIGTYRKGNTPNQYKAGSAFYNALERSSNESQNVQLSSNESQLSSNESNFHLMKGKEELKEDIKENYTGDSIEDFIPGLQQRKQTEYQPVKPGSPEAMMLALGITAKDNNPLAEQIEDLHNYGWHIKQANVETAIAAFLTATQLHIPTVTAERKKWIAGAEAHIQEFGVEGLAARYKAAWDEVFPKILDGQLDITHPAALTFKLRAQLQRNHLTENKKPVAKRYIDPQDPRNWKALGYTE